jgi:hypothetical protein
MKKSMHLGVGLLFLFGVLFFFLPVSADADGSYTGTIKDTTKKKDTWNFYETDSDGKLLPKKGIHGRGNRGIAFWNASEKLGFWYLAEENPHDSGAYNKHQTKYYDAFAKAFIGSKDLKKPDASLTISKPCAATMNLQAGTWKPGEGFTPTPTGDSSSSSTRRPRRQ